MVFARRESDANLSYGVTSRRLGRLSRVNLGESP